jgi:hypothetical protein
VNATREPVTAQVRLDRDEATATLAPGGRFVAAFPVQLYRPGARALHLSWGSPDEPATDVVLSVTVPEPVEVAAIGGLISPNSIVDLPVRLNLSAYDQQRYKLRLLLSNGSRTLRRDFPATNRRMVNMPLRVSGMARLQVALVNHLGREVWQSPEYAFMVLPE